MNPCPSRLSDQRLQSFWSFSLNVGRKDLTMTSSCIVYQRYLLGLPRLSFYCDGFLGPGPRGLIESPRSSYGCLCHSELIGLGVAELCEHSVSFFETWSHIELIFVISVFACVFNEDNKLPRIAVGNVPTVSKPVRPRNPFSTTTRSSVIEPTGFTASLSALTYLCGNRSA